MHQYKIFTLFFQVILTVNTLYCGFERTSQPTQVFSRGMSGSAFFSEQQAWINPASIAHVPSFRTSMFYSPSPFQLSQLSNYGVITSSPFWIASAAVGFSSFGFSLYRESTGSIVLGSAINEHIAAGVGIHLCHLSIEKYGSSTKGVMDIGMIYSLNEQVNIGLVLNNLSGASFGGDDDIPRVITSGISYSFSEQAAIHMDVVKDVRFAAAYRAGFDIRLHDYIVVNAGTRSDASQLCGGIGIVIPDWQIDYGITTHTELGLTHSIGITFHP
ncbi:MAG: hypothetical protein WCW35_01020 [Bacteroidota bacterium]|jgi:hypothetical protein